MTAATLDATVLIATFNRAALLDVTLQSVARLRAGQRRWEVLVVDNNSTDETRAVVERHQRASDVPVRYVFETRQGRSQALNTGIAAASGAVIAMTDDDVHVDEGWLEAACAALLTADPGSPAIRYAGGPVEPMWEVPPPRWLDLTRGDLWGTIAIQDHGREAFVYEEARKVPLGANLAAHRSLFEEAGAFRVDLGRSAGKTPLGQEVPEWLMRVHAAGGRGLYVPAMRVRHHIPAARLTRRYLPPLVVRKGRLSRGARARPADHGARPRSAKDAARARCAALHVRHRRARRARLAARPGGRRRHRRRPPRDDARLFRGLRPREAPRPRHFTVKTVRTGRWSLGVFPFASRVS